MIFKTRIYLIILFGALVILSGLQGSAIAQIGNNPFEIHRQPGRSDTLATLQSDNPFDVGLNRTLPQAEKPLPQGPVFKHTQTENKGFLFWLILLMLILLAIITSTSRESLTKVYRSFTNQNFMSLMHRNMGHVIYPSYLLMYTLFVLNLGLFLLFALEFWYPDVTTVNFRTYAMITSGVAGIFLAKHCLLSVIAWIFPFGKVLRLYSFTIAIFNMIAGLVLLPLNILTTYTPTGFHPTLIYLTLIVVGGVFLVRTLRALLLGSRYLLFHKFHFLLYLCGVELAPVLILIKLVEKQGLII